MDRSYKNSITVIGLALLLLMTGAVFGQTNVNVVNGNSAPVPVLNVNDAQQPFQKRVGTLQQPNNTVSQLNLITVPAGKRLVIEFISMHGQVPAGQRISFWRLTTITGNEIANVYPLITQQPDFTTGDAMFSASQTVKLYADEGTTVRASFHRSDSTGVASVEVSIAGYLVDLP